MANSPEFPFRIDFPPELPISSRAEEVVAAIQAHPVVILAGETGSGKTTQIPKMCLAAGRGVRGRIACTQPRRVAALSISRRVAEELNVAWGQEVGCKVRFDDRTGRRTVIKFLTDGMLLAEMQADPGLREYDTIIIDEAHERSLNIDFLLGHLRQLHHRRDDLKVVITSATIDTEAFSRAFDDAPVIQVSGRMYPVEVIYAPLDEFGSDAAEDDEPTAKAEALHYIDGAVEAVERILRESTDGDILVFLPAERDIREARDLLDGRRLQRIDIVPLFGRLSNAEQQRVFAPSQLRKIVLSTNIAETSLTIPGIRFVVDSGLARVSRYSPQSRTRRLPIEEVSQSSADQRKGRCGRVAEGVCVRLYSEKDYLERERFTQPEIQRANLADVILRMKAFGLGEIERFPFINMPATKAVRAGYGLLEELGALGDETETGAAEPKAGSRARAGVELGAPSAAHERPLTAIGRELARLPVDPTVGRMILQGRVEKCLREVLVIAAGLSIQDPRERPMDAREKADAAHRRFAHPDSDFLTLLAIWESYHDEFETMTQSKMRRFCHQHFLSYTRMREWRDIHNQLVDVLQEREDFRITSVYDGIDARQRAEPSIARLGWGTPAFRAIHRSVLTGLLGNIALRDDEGGGYKATHDRRVVIFPGSVLAQRDERRDKSAERGRSAAKKEAKSPRWIMAAEMVETSRLYARTCARLDPAWVLELGSHLVKRTHSEPFWNVDGGRVMVKQRTRLYGLEIESRAVGYGKINPRDATDVFVREGLVNDTITWPFDFLTHNRKLRDETEVLLTRARDSGYLNLDEATYRFYLKHLWPEGAEDVPEGEVKGVASVAELVDLVRHRRENEPRFLCMEPADLRAEEAPVVSEADFPREFPLENRVVSLNYAYKPGKDEDGVTVELRLAALPLVEEKDLDWAVPGHLREKVEHYLKAAPKELRRAFVPLAETAKSMAAQVAQRDRLTGRRERLTEALAACLAERFGLQIDPAMWADKPLPDHLRVRIRLVDENGAEIIASRDLADVRAAAQARGRELNQTISADDPEAWRRARAKCERPSSVSWNFGDIPGKVVVTKRAEIEVEAFPALVATESGVAVRLLRTREEQEAATAAGVAKLLQLQLRYELAWLERDLKSLRELGALVATLGSIDDLRAQAVQTIARWVCERKLEPLTAGNFDRLVAQARVDLRASGEVLKQRLREILTVRLELLNHPNPYPGLEADLARLVPNDFLGKVSFARLRDYPRFLQAMKLRAERWRQNPAKDAERAATVRTFDERSRTLAGATRESFAWWVEEFRVSLFAQELGTTESVSAVKLERVWAELTGGKTVVSGAPKATPSTPIVVTNPAKKQVKSLGSLDSLFRK